jgi:hypothetical protein
MPKKTRPRMTRVLIQPKNTRQRHPAFVRPEQDRWHERGWYEEKYGGDQSPPAWIRIMSKYRPECDGSKDAPDGKTERPKLFGCNFGFHPFSRRGMNRKQRRNLECRLLVTILVNLEFLLAVDVILVSLLLILV